MCASETGGRAGARVAQVVRTLTEIEEQLRRDEQERKSLDARWDEALGVVHSVNNALSVISTVAGVLLDDLEADDPTRESLAEILGASKRAAALTRELAALAPQKA